jgi:hypothetical protein
MALVSEAKQLTAPHVPGQKFFCANFSEVKWLALKQDSFAQLSSTGCDNFLKNVKRGMT